MKYRIVAGLPGVPYSSFEVTFDPEEAPEVEAIADYAAAWASAFRDAGLVDPNRVPERQVNSAPPQRSAPAQRPQGASGGQYGGPWLCPEHRVEVRPSARNKTMDWDEELGMEIPASWMHKLDDGKWCSVYRSKLVHA